MSRENEEWVWQNSPYKGGALLLHLAMGDLANHQNHNELWAEDEYLADRARINVGTLRRLRSAMVKDGYLEIIETGGGRGRRVRVRLLKPSQIVQVSGKPDDDKPAQLDLETRAIPTTNARNSDQGLLVNANQRKGTDTCDALLGFVEFWNTYPRRNGKRLHRGKCEDIWRHLPIDDRRAAWRGARNYGTACAAGLTIACDPDRYLRRRDWEDWQDPATPDAPSAARPRQHGDNDPRGLGDLVEAARRAER